MEQAKLTGGPGLDVRSIPAGTRDLSRDVLDANGRMRVLPASFWAATTTMERAKFGMLNGIYSFPTVELVDYLNELIGDRKAIEIGSGNGVLAAALGIPATDSMQQDEREYAAVYKALGAPTVPYGRNVVAMPAIRALRYHKPDVVIGCWVTHKWLLSRAAAGGNEAGVDEEEVLRSCQEYVFVGNTRVHTLKPILALPHTTEHFPWLYSRAFNGTPDFIARWQGRKRPKSGD